MATDAGKDVLIVDDDEHIRGLLKATLTRVGLTCDTAADGVFAVEHLLARRYGLVLLDLMMPRLDGAGVLGEMRALGPADERPMVVVLTSTTDRAPLRPVADLVQAVITKPFDLGRLGELVQDCIAARRMATRGLDRRPDLAC